MVDYRLAHGTALLDDRNAVEACAGALLLLSAHALADRPLVGCHPLDRGPPPRSYGTYATDGSYFGYVDGAVSGGTVSSLGRREFR